MSDGDRTQLAKLVKKYGSETVSSAALCMNIPWNEQQRKLAAFAWFIEERMQEHIDARGTKHGALKAALTLAYQFTFGTTDKKLKAALALRFPQEIWDNQKPDEASWIVCAKKDYQRGKQFLKQGIRIGPVSPYDLYQGKKSFQNYFPK